jgi:hypothetical protein
MYLVNAIILVAVFTTIGKLENKWKKKGLSNLYQNTAIFWCVSYYIFLVGEFSDSNVFRWAEINRIYTMNFWVTCDYLDLITGFSSPLFLSVDILDRYQVSFSVGQSKRLRPSSRHEGMGGVNIWLHSFLSWALPEDDYPASHIDRFIPGRLRPLPVQ